MIPVSEQPEPSDFSTKVRNIGLAFLARVPNPTNRDFKHERHWKHAAKDLYLAYKGICAYCAHWIPFDTARETVDHFIPKSNKPDLAYEWSNFRLSSEKLNLNKANSLEVMDPFKINFGWFILNFSTFMIEPENSLPKYLQDRIDATITQLKLNDDDSLIQGRVHLVQLYVDGDVSFNFLKEKYPFIAYELDRQGLKDTIKTMLKKPSHTI